MALFLLALLRMGAGQLTQVFIDRIPGDLEPLGHKRHRLAEGESVFLVQQGDDLHPIPLVQDADRLHNRATALGVNCPNCGAPVKTLGEKFCQFCGTAIKEINIRSWKFNSVNEQTLQQRKF